MQEKIAALHNNKTWIVVPLPTPTSLALSGCLDSNTLKMVEYKACLITNGYAQVPGLNYEETFSTVVIRQSLNCCYLGLLYQTTN